MPEKYVKVYLVSGAGDAVLIKMFLEASGIPAVFYEESAGIVYGLTVGPLAEAEIWVPESRAEEARELLEKMENGELSLPVSNQDEDTSDESGDESSPEAQDGEPGQD